MIFLFAVLLLLPSVAFGQIIINEIAWMGVPVEGVDAKQEWRYEWIELYNAGEQTVFVQGWRIELYSGPPAGGLDFTIVLYGSVPANGYFLVGASDKIPGVNINYATLAGKFKNPGQHVVLKDASGTVVEEIDAGSGWYGGDNDLKLTMERRFPDRPAADEENWGSSKNTGGTPKAQNSLFGKEKFVTLNQNSLAVMDETKKEPVWASFFQAVGDPVFIRAFLVALLFAAVILVLRQYLMRSLPRGEDSFDVRQD
ncbi:MAG: lamin tail domain-containing protein [Candidatus Wildermuthbacteria bacterium]|nr:lamin tail domain-containing protein [Candidatus Wildermuthbacteria bacterium]